MRGWRILTYKAIGFEQSLQNSFYAIFPYTKPDALGTQKENKRNQTHLQEIVNGRKHVLEEDRNDDRGKDHVLEGKQQMDSRVSLQHAGDGVLQEGRVQRLFPNAQQL